MRISRKTKLSGESPPPPPRGAVGFFGFCEFSKKKSCHVFLPPPPRVLVRIFFLLLVRGRAVKQAWWVIMIAHAT